MRPSISSFVIATAIAVALPTRADARPPRARRPAPALAPMPPAPPLAPLPPVDAMAIAPPAPPAVLAPAAPPAMPPGVSFSFSFGQGRLGAQVSSMTPELRRFFGARDDAGLLVQGVDLDTPAGKAGVTVGDVIVEVDGAAIDDIGDVAEALADRNSGDTVDVVVIRGKKRRELRAELRDDGNAMGTFPGGRFHVFGGDDDLRQELEELRDRLRQLEEELGHKPAKKKSKAPAKPGAGVRPKAKRGDPKRT